MDSIMKGDHRSISILMRSVLSHITTCKFKIIKEIESAITAAVPARIGEPSSAVKRLNWLRVFYRDNLR
jgi:hypothetical protein